MLLVRNFIDCVGSFGCSWRLLVASALVLCLHHSFSRRNRLHSQLAEESLVSLCHHRTAVRHRSDSLLGWKPGPRARARKFGMVTALRRNRRSVPVGMEIRKAFLTSARPSLILFGRNLGFFPCRRDGFYVVLPYQIIQGHEIFRLDLAPSGQLCLQSPV